MTRSGPVEGQAATVQKADALRDAAEPLRLRLLLPDRRPPVLVHEQPVDPRPAVLHPAQDAAARIRPPPWPRPRPTSRPSTRRPWRPKPGAKPVRTKPGRPAVPPAVGSTAVDGTGADVPTSDTGSATANGSGSPGKGSASRSPGGKSGRHRPTGASANAADRPRRRARRPAGAAGHRPPGSSRPPLPTWRNSVSAPQQPSTEAPSTADVARDRRSDAVRRPVRPVCPTPTPRATTPSSSRRTSPATAVTTGTGGADGADGDDLLVREGDVAGDYLERLLDILDVDGDIDLDVEGDRASVAIVGGRLERPDRARRGHPRGAAGAHPPRGRPVHRRPQPADARRRRLPGQAPGRPDRRWPARRPAGSRESASPSG